MAEIAFHKYHGAGNDFIVIDNRKKLFPEKNYKLIEQLCDRRFGIGADGLLLLNKSKAHDFEMGYYNADGKPGSMCGNGGRCIVYFAKQAGINKKKFVFTAADGIHQATLISENAKTCTAVVKLKMNDVQQIEKCEKDFFLNTGSPHYVRFVNDPSKINVMEEGMKIRNSKPFKAKGTNVNFVVAIGNEIFIRTYERGVENETLACGTGITAAAICAVFSGRIPFSKKVKVTAMGGKLHVYLNKTENAFTDIYLEGGAQKVSEGLINI